MVKFNNEYKIVYFFSLSLVVDSLLFFFFFFFFRFVYGRWTRIKLNIQSCSPALTNLCAYFISNWNDGAKLIKFNFLGLGRGGKRSLRETMDDSSAAQRLYSKCMPESSSRRQQKCCSKRHTIISYTTTHTGHTRATLQRSRNKMKINAHTISEQTHTSL